MSRQVESQIIACRSGVARIYSMLQTTPSRWQDYVPFARSLTTSLDAVDFVSIAGRAEEQVWFIDGIQRLAYSDADSGGVRDLADWCQRKWLGLLQFQPQLVEALKGLGQSWLLRAQNPLAQIHDEESISSSSRSPSVSNNNNRVQTANYVEAREFLLPSTEFFKRAVDAAEVQHRVNGALLALAAEAYLSLGNVSTPNEGIEYFGQAVRYLRRARQIPRYPLPPHLQQLVPHASTFLDPVDAFVVDFCMTMEGMSTEPGFSDSRFWQVCGFVFVPINSILDD
ncbi:MAG: hypothetical protein M1833_000253 [Piccolia ochrophora]|nr:MAG: hypothetical protein M1833_000253 [Piccolia ochrophora]